MPADEPNRKPLQSEDPVFDLSGEDEPSGVVDPLAPEAADVKPLTEAEAREMVARFEAAKRREAESKTPPG
jgi:hypothetical protein